MISSKLRSNIFNDIYFVALTIYIFRDLDYAMLNRLVERQDPKQNKKREDRRFLQDKLGNGQIALEPFMTAIGSSLEF